MLTAGRLKEILKDVPDDTPIVMQSDDEGNGYRYANGLEFNTSDDPSANYFGEDPFGDEMVVRRKDLEHEADLSNYVLVAVAF